MRSTIEVYMYMYTSFYSVYTLYYVLCIIRSVLIGQIIEINDVRCSKKELKQVQSILKKNFKLSLKVRSNLPGIAHTHLHVHVMYNVHIVHAHL